MFSHIKGQEELIRTFPSIIDNQKVLDEVTEECEKNKLLVEKDLGLLQRDNLALTTALKTKTAVRTILNTQVAQVKKFKSGGILDDHESGLLLNVIQRNMKALLFSFPMKMDPLPESDMIKSIPWLAGNEQMINFMKLHAERIDFDTEDILIQEGEFVDGVYLITSGMVRIFGRGMNEIDDDEDYEYDSADDCDKHY